MTSLGKSWKIFDRIGEWTTSQISNRGAKRGFFIIIHTSTCYKIVFKLKNN